MNKTNEYVITDGEFYIKQNLNGNYSRTKNFSLADIYNKKTLAENICKNALSYTLKKKFYVAKVEGGEVVKCISPIAKASDAIYDNPGESVVFDFIDENLLEMISTIEDFKDLITKSIHRGAVVATELQEVDREKNEILHAIEGYDFNACKACKIEVELKKVLRKRRALVNEQKLICALNKLNDAKPTINAVFAEIEQLKNQKYTPKLRADLFV